MADAMMTQLKDGKGKPGDTGQGKGVKRALGASTGKLRGSARRTRPPASEAAPASGKETEGATKQAAEEMGAEATEAKSATTTEGIAQGAQEMEGAKEEGAREGLKEGAKETEWPEMPTDGAPLLYRNVQITLRNSPKQQAWRVFFQQKHWPSVTESHREALRQFGTEKKRDDADKKRDAFKAALECVDRRLQRMAAAVAPTGAEATCKAEPADGAAPPASATSP